MLRIFLVIDDYNELIYLQSLLKKMGFDVEGLQNPKKYADVSLGFNPQLLITTAKGQKVDGLALARSINKRRGIPKVLALRTPAAHVSPAEFQSAGVDEVLDSPINPRKLMLAIASLGGVDENMLLEKYNKIKSSAITEEDVQQILVHNEHQSHDAERVKEALEKAAREHDDGGAVFNVKNDEATDGGGARFPLNPVSAESPAAAGVTHGKLDAKTESEPAAAGASEIANGEPAAIMKRRGRFEQWVKEVGKLPRGHFARDRITEFNKKIRASGTSEDIDQIEGERREFVRALFKGKKKA